MAGSISDEKLRQVIYDYAWHWVNTCAGNKTAAYSRAFGEEKSRTSAYNFYQRHKEEMDALIEKFRAENRAEYPHMRDSNIAILTDIAVNGAKDNDRISAIKELDSIMGYNSTNINMNGRMDGEIEVNITNL